MLSKLIDNINQVNAVLPNEAGTFRQVNFFSSSARNEPDNEVLAISWTDNEGFKCFTTFTEENISMAVYVPETDSFALSDSDGDPFVLRLKFENEWTAQAGGETVPAVVHVTVQEGGSSGEFYLCSFDTTEAALAFRGSCADEGSYRTSGVVEVPASLAAHPDFIDVASALVLASHDVSYPTDD